jgi:hypothetical protein
MKTTTVTYSCDRCGKEVNGESDLYTLEGTITLAATIRINKDYCLNCATFIINKIAQRLEDAKP